MCRYAVDPYLSAEIREISELEDLLYRIVRHGPHRLIAGVLHLILQFDDCGRSFPITGDDGDIRIPCSNDCITP